MPFKQVKNCKISHFNTFKFNGFPLLARDWNWKISSSWSWRQEYIQYCSLFSLLLTTSNSFEAWTKRESFLLKSLQQHLRSNALSKSIVSLYLVSLSPTRFWENIKIIMNPGLLHVSGICFTIGQLIGIVIVWRLCRLESLSFLNKLYIIYFTVDVLAGTVEMYFLLKLVDESVLHDPDLQKLNCTGFLLLFFIIYPQKWKFNTGMLFCR